MTAVVFAFKARKSEPQSWQNHEISEFYRVIEILGRAGLSVVSDMGLSDEGDPWFAFCRADNGDVVVHCARIDGEFLATSIATEEVFRGKEIRDVIDGMCRQFAAVTQPSRDRRVHLHPAMVFTAFIAAALMFSKQAGAQDLHSDGAASTSDNPLTFVKIFAAYKDLVGAKAYSTSGVIWNTSETSSSTSDSATFSLAALISAALTTIAPIIQESDGFTLPSTNSTASPNPYSLTDFHVIPAFPLFSIFDQGIKDGLAADGPPFSLFGSTAAPIKPSDWTAGSGNLVIPESHDELSTQGSGQVLKFLSSNETFNPDLVNHPMEPQFHSGSTVITLAADAGSSTIQLSFQLSSASVKNHLINEVTPVALSIFLGQPLSSNLAGMASALSTDHVNSLTNSPSTAISLDSSPLTDLPTNLSATPSTIVIGENPIVAIGQLLNYALTSHPIDAPLTVSPSLAAELHALGGSAQLVVFDSTDIKLPVFEFVQGVLFVDDHELGMAPSQASPSQVVTVDLASGGMMTLLGVVDTAHLTF